MDILKDEIARKRKELESTQLINKKKKFFKRGELEAIKRAEYIKKHKISIDNNSDNLNRQNSETSDEENQLLNLPRTEVVQRLRDRGEPILLFGESETEAFNRLRHCEILEPESNKGFRNDFQEAMEKVDQDYLDQLLAEPLLPEDNEATTINVSYDDIKVKALTMGIGNRDRDMETVMSFLQLILKMWGDQLKNRPAIEKRATKGKMAGATYAQTKVYLTPLLRKLKNRNLPEDISDSLTEIVRHLLNRNYLMASDAYLQMAIGNAPWPIGVTMVGIHARTGREKIFSKNVAHVMNDETQRKYIQALKRLMTKCQEYFPTDPSRCVEYAAFGSPPRNPNILVLKETMYLPEMNYRKSLDSGIFIFR